MNMQAYAKIGLMGFAGSGKTFTAINIAIGLLELMNERGVSGKDNPVYFLDTETGSDWVEPHVRNAGYSMRVAKTRAFADLVPAIEESEKEGSILIIDSITHFWKELTESYARKRNRRNGLQFQDWAWLKESWGRFTDEYVNSNIHIIMCGRAGYEYDYFENESGKKELEKTGIKMKAETETGYEPSLLILMEKQIDMETKKTYRTATVLKDRADLIDGQVFRNPSFSDFYPHFNFLNLGGKQLGVDTSRNSEGIIDPNGKTDWQKAKEEKEIVLDEIQSLMTKYYPSTSKEDKREKINLLEKHFNSKSWKRVETYPLNSLQECYKNLQIELEGATDALAQTLPAEVDDINSELGID